MARSSTLAWFVTVPLAFVSIIIATYLHPSLSLIADHWQAAAVFFALCLIADVSKVRVEIQRQVFSYTLTDIPLLLALFYLPPPLVVFARLASASCVQLLWRRKGQEPVKSWFNVAAQTAAASIA